MMDNNEYRTQLIVRSYHCAENPESFQKECEGWFLFVGHGIFKLQHFGELILSVEKGDIFLSSKITLQNRIPHFVVKWFEP
ncbi:hypothetical protein QUF56_12230 [Ureibacillus composti]|nr:hypothetical protein [Ureibacillus composti]